MNETPSVTPPSPPCQSTSRSLWQRLRDLATCFVRDIDAVLSHDPAARSRSEVVCTYPGLHALWIHRVAHALWQKKLFFLARLLSHTGRFLTGVELHPGATIGRGVFIDHGMGVVVGETAVIGDECILYKGVVLGGTSMARTTRHPQLGKRVVIGSNACVLGGIAVGDGARIGSGSVVIRPVPEGATVVGVPGRIVPRQGDAKARFEATLDHASLPDPVSEMVRTLRDENDALRARLSNIEKALKIPSPRKENAHHLIDADLATTDLPRVDTDGTDDPSR
ncbi:MAG: serine O-acetyltransferase [Myxococcales bacterium]|nr:serine O-acetyltransferase [Myxococcales bacterium]